MRNAFVDELVKIARDNDKIFLIVGDLGFSVVEPFADLFPARFINAGIAEQNMAGLAAGMASEGYHVFVYSIANFPLFRCAEQIRNDIAYHNLPVTIVSVGGGLAYGNLGYSHHAIQDYGLIRLFPNMLIASPGDPNEVRGCVRYLAHNPQPSYFRIGKAGESNYNSTIPSIDPGIWNMVRERGSNVLLTTGAALSIAHEWSQYKDYEDFSICSIPLWGGDSKDMQQSQIDRWASVITIEDHLKECGFGDWLLSSLNNDLNLVKKIQMCGLDTKVCNYVAKQEELNRIGGLYNFSMPLNVN